MKKRIRVLVFTSVVLVVSSVLFGVCVPGAVAAEKQYGGIFKLILYSRPGTPIGWPPEMSYRDVTVSQVPLESLLRLRYDLTTEPMLATSWDIAPDMRSITFNLRKGVKFHDGTDFNAKAAKFNLDGLKSAKKAGTQVWTAIDILDDYKIKVSLSKWDNTMLESIGTSQMVSPAAFKTMGLEKVRWHPVGTGAYKFVSHVHDVGTKFTRFDGYWKGKPYLDGLEIMYIVDPMTQKAKMLAGEADANWSPNIKVGSDLKAAGFNVLYN
ncbi:ABC transporter substrate-binding protein, partial [Thermodesulfobacteriota bacterium]